MKDIIFIWEIKIYNKTKKEALERESPFLC